MQDKHANYLVHRAVRDGHLVPKPCEVCGATETVGPHGKHRIHAHHPDYNKPLEVIWLCMPCHRKLRQKSALGPNTMTKLLRLRQRLSIEGLLEVGISQKAISKRLNCDPKVVSGITKDWKKKLLPIILKKRWRLDPVH